MLVEWPFGSLLLREVTELQRNQVGWLFVQFGSGLLYTVSPMETDSTDCGKLR